MSFAGRAAARTRRQSQHDHSTFLLVYAVAVILCQIFTFQSFQFAASNPVSICRGVCFKDCLVLPISMFAKPFSPPAALYLSAAQVVLAPIIAAVTKTKLDSTGDCLLNETPGRVCDFVYSTVGFSLLFTLMLAIPTLLWQRNPKTAYTAPLIQEAGNLSWFGAFWWMVLSITITARGKQADDAGYDGTGARGAVIAFAWILTALFFFAGLIVYADRILHAYRIKPKGEDEDVSSQPDSEGYVYTQALARTPVS